MVRRFLLNFFYIISEKDCDFNNCSSTECRLREGLYPTLYKLNYIPHPSGDFLYSRQYDYYTFYNLHNESFLITHHYDILTDNICYYVLLLEKLNTCCNPVGQYDYLLKYFSEVVKQHVCLTYNIGQCIYIDSYIHTTLSLMKAGNHNAVLDMFSVFEKNLSILNELGSYKKTFLWNSNHIGGSLHNCRFYLNSNLSIDLINCLIDNHWSNKDPDTKLNIILSPDYINNATIFDYELSHKHYTSSFKFGNALVLGMGLLSVFTIIYNNY